MHEKYKNTKKVTYIYLAIPLVSASVSSKGSIAAMLLVSIFLIYFKDVITLGFKNILTISAILFSFLLLIFYEDTKSNGLSIVELESGSSTNSNYNFKAPKSFVYKLNGYELVSSPIKINMPIHL